MARRRGLQRTNSALTWENSSSLPAPHATIRFPLAFGWAHLRMRTSRGASSSHRDGRGGEGRNGETARGRGSEPGGFRHGSRAGVGASWIRFDSLGLGRMGWNEIKTEIRIPKSEIRNKSKFFNRINPKKAASTRLAKSKEWHFFGTVEGGGCGVTFWGFMGVRG